MINKSLMRFACNRRGESSKWLAVIMTLISTSLDVATTTRVCWIKKYFLPSMGNHSTLALTFGRFKNGHRHRSKLFAPLSAQKSEQRYKFLFNPIFRVLLTGTIDLFPPNGNGELLLLAGKSISRRAHSNKREVINRTLVPRFGDA